jgi:hypothetical protein
MEIKKISHLMVEYTKTIHNVRPCWTIAEQYVQNTSPFGRKICVDNTAENMSHQTQQPHIPTLTPRFFSVKMTLKNHSFMLNTK